MVELITYKDMVFLAFLVIALIIEGRRQFRVGIEAGVEGTINSLVEDGYIDVDEKGEISPKNA
jgi:hypothetical protein